MERPVIAIGGPTAVGKTAVGIALAERIGGEIISADSTAVYRGLDIGTAKPTREERARVPFHLLDVVRPDEPFNVSEFKRLARQAIADIRERGRQPIVLGGTGLYLRALLDDYGLTSTPADPQLRAALNREADEKGVRALHARLEQLDPEAAARIHPNDRVRIVRALEVVLRTGEPISAQQARDARVRRPLQARKFVLTMDRVELMRRIDARADEQMAAGLLEEVRGLLESGYAPSLTSLRSLGYKELAAHLRGEMRLEEAIRRIKANNRRFAKRQWTWFRAERDWTWIDVTGMTPEETAERIMKLLQTAD